MIVPVILSGGSGTRLWPLSREGYPKQLLRLSGPHTLLQDTVMRVVGGAAQDSGAAAAIAAPLVVCGDVNVFEKILTRYQDHVFAVVGKHVPHDMVEEVAHDAFVRIYQSLSTFKHHGSFKYWLTRIPDVSWGSALSAGIPKG